MQEWTDEFIRHAQQELVAMVKDWQYDYGPTDEECAAMIMGGPVVWVLVTVPPSFKDGPIM